MENPAPRLKEYPCHHVRSRGEESLTSFEVIAIDDASHHSILRDGCECPTIAVSEWDCGGDATLRQPPADWTIQIVEELDSGIAFIRWLNEVEGRHNSFDHMGRCLIGESPDELSTLTYGCFVALLCGIDNSGDLEVSELT